MCFTRIGILQAIDKHLDMLRPAIKSYGGFVDVVELKDGMCSLDFEGPGPIGRGIQAAIKDKFPDVTEVIILDQE